MRRVLTAALAAALTIGAVPAPSMRDVLRSAYAVRDLSNVDLAPSGEAVAWEEDFHDPGAALGIAALGLRSAGSERRRRQDAIDGRKRRRLLR